MIMNDNDFELYKALRHSLHMCAELSGEENKTKSLLMEFLLSHTQLELHDMGKWFYAVYRSGNDNARRIAFRADFDALPICETGLDYNSQNIGVSHKCGHDGHSASLCAFACEVFKDKPDNVDIFFVFQHGEETGIGAKEITDTGFIEQNNIKAVFAYHNIPCERKNVVLIKRGTFACASLGMIIKLIGTESHAAYPEYGKNPAFVAAKILESIENIGDMFEYLTRCTVIRVDIGKEAFGTSAGEGKIMLTLRSEDENSLEKIINMIKDNSESICRQYGISASYEFTDVFPMTKNYDKYCDLIEKSCKEAGLEFKNIDVPFRWSEDFGYFLKHTSGAIVGIGCGESHSQLHTVDYDFDDDLIKTAVKLFKSLCY